MRLIYGERVNDALVDWVAARIPHMNGAPFPPATAIGVISADGTELLGGVVFSNHAPQYRSVEWSAASASARWLTPRIISAIMTYPFETLAVKRITAVIPKKNKRARAFQERFGFKSEGLARRAFGNDDACIYGLLVNDWSRSRFNVAARQNQMAA